MQTDDMVAIKEKPENGNMDKFWEEAKKAGEDFIREIRKKDEEKKG